MSDQFHTAADQPMGRSSGIAYTCDGNGFVLTSILNDFEPALSLTEGELPFGTGGDWSTEGYQAFIKELNDTGDVFGWELPLTLGETPLTLFLHGISHENHLAVVGTTSHLHLIRMLDEYLVINSTLVDQVRELHRLRAATSRSRVEDRSISEMLELNNELVNLQRQMVQRNKELSRRERFIRSIVTASPDLIYIYDLLGQKMTFINDTIEKFVGRSADQVLAMIDPISELNLAPNPLVVGGPIFEEFTGQDSDRATVEWSSEIEGTNGQSMWLLSRAARFEDDDDGTPLSVMVVAADVTELRAAQQQLREMATHDLTTNLLNRRGLFAQVGTLVASCKRMGAPLSVMMLDLDGLKEINDELGHAAGDRAIADAGQILSRSTRESDLVARIGGDEFVVVAPNTDEDGAAELVRRINDAVARRNIGEDQNILSVSIGCMTALPPDEYDFDRLLNVADDKMYAHKNGKRQSASRPTGAPPAWPRGES